MADVEVRDNPTAQHWEAVVDGDGTPTVAGFAQYTVEGDTVVFVHTEVDPRYEGQGIGSALVRQSLDAVRRESRKVRPECSFYRDFIDGHPDYADLLES